MDAEQNKTKQRPAELMSRGEISKATVLQTANKEEHINHLYLQCILTS